MLGKKIILCQNLQPQKNISGAPNIQGQAGSWRGRRGSIRPAAVPEASFLQAVPEAGAEVGGGGAAEVSGGLHLRDGPQARQAVQPVPGGPARRHPRLQEGEDGAVLHDGAPRPQQQEVHPQDPGRHLSNMR